LETGFLFAIKINTLIHIQKEVKRARALTSRHYWCGNKRDNF